MVQVVKNLPATQETKEDPLEKGMATYSSILAWRIPWTEEPGGLQSMGSQRDTSEPLILSRGCQRAGETLFLGVSVQLFLEEI